MSKAGRPLTEIDWTEFDKLCLFQCTLREISSWFNCSEDTIERAVEREYKVNFAEYYHQKAGRGKISIRRKQFELALNGNVTLLIWLGKQMLGQIDRAQLDVHKIPDDIFLEEAQRRLKSGPEEPRDVSADTNELPKDKAKV